MRPLEASILLVLFFSLIDLVRAGPRTRWVLVLPGVAVLLVLADLALVGSRWQMVAVWLASGTVLLIAGWRLAQRAESATRPRWRKAAHAGGFALGVMALVVSAAAFVLFPLFDLPIPTGSHAVGTRYFHLTDRSRLDLERVGVMGFSKGGASTGQFCVTDERCGAGVNLGGFMFGDAVEKPLRRPFLFMEHVEPWCEDCPPIHQHLYQRAESSAYAVQVHGARHMNFTDWSLAGGFLKLADLVGPIDGRRFVELQNRYVLAFFDRHLKGRASPFLDGPPDDYPEVAFKARKP